MDKEKITIDKLYSNQLENFDKHENSDIEKYQTKIKFQFYLKCLELLFKIKLNFNFNSRHLQNNRKIK